MCACCLSFMGLTVVTPVSCLSGVLASGVEPVADAVSRQPPAHLVQHPLQLRVRLNRLTSLGGRGNQSQEAEPPHALPVTLLRGQDFLDRNHALLSRNVPFRRPPRLQRADVYPVLEEALDELVVAGRGLRAVVAVDEPEPLEPLALRVGERDRRGLPSLRHAGEYLSVNNSRPRPGLTRLHPEHLVDAGGVAGRELLPPHVPTPVRAQRKRAD